MYYVIHSHAICNSPSVISSLNTYKIQTIIVMISYRRWIQTVFIWFVLCHCQWSLSQIIFHRIEIENKISSEFIRRMKLCSQLHFTFERWRSMHELYIAVVVVWNFKYCSRIRRLNWYKWQKNCCAKNIKYNFFLKTKSIIRNNLQNRPNSVFR